VLDLLKDLLRELLSKWGIGITLLVFLVWYLLKRYLDSIEKKVKLVERRADKEIDRLVQERDRLQDKILENRIPSGRPSNVETTDN